MAKRKNDTEFTVEDAQLALEKLESKLEELTDVIEEKLVNNKTSGPQRAPKTKVKVVSMPSDDIEVDMSDPYNTQPKNSVTHNYLKNHRMFRKDALRNVIKSKMF